MSNRELTSNVGEVSSDGAAIAKDAAGEESASRAAQQPTRRSDPNDNRVFVGDRAYLTRQQTSGAEERILDILPDIPDLRDRIYQPHLRSLQSGIYPTIAFPVRDQGKSPRCVGYALAHVIDVLRHQTVSATPRERVSARMLYEMGLRNDEWADSPHDGSSLRGALKGFFRNGVCKEGPTDKTKKDWLLTYELAKEATETRLGAYFRLQPDISDYHAALNEVGGIYASAQIHGGWLKPVNGYITPDGAPIGGHAFAIVGYDAEGFWILNSWGEKWSREGLAHWAYSDWAATIMDAWVLQLGARAPSAFNALPKSSPTSRSGLFGINEPTRADILGHFLNIDDGKLVVTGKYASPKEDEMAETVKRLTMKESNNGKGYPHLMIYAHGGLNSTVDEARRISAWKRANIFGRNSIYNFHLMWASDFLDEAFGAMSSATSGLAGAGFSDWLFEAGPGKYYGNRAWRNMKGDAEAAFSGRREYDGGFQGLEPLLQGLDTADLRPKIHLVGHSAGSIVLGRLISALGRFKLKNLTIDSVHLMAPACTTDFFNEHYGKLLKGTSTLRLSGNIHLYMMSDDLEKRDTVEAGIPLTPRYSHSLLYLVSRAYEEQPHTPIAGMEIYGSKIGKNARLIVDKSMSEQTMSRSHGGFDNDAATLTTIIERINGTRPSDELAPRDDELRGY